MLPDEGCPDAEHSPDQLRVRIAELEATVERLENRLSGYDRVFLNSPVPAILYAAATLQILEANEGALQLYGFSRAELCARKVSDLLDPADVRADNISSEFARPINVIGPLLQRGAGGQPLTVRMVVFTLDIDGVDARISMLQDETARHRAEEALRASEERYRDLFENANDVIFLHDLKGKVLAINRAGEALTGYSRGEVLGANFFMLVAPEARRDFQDSIPAQLGGSPTQHYELPMVSKAGVQRFVEVSTRILYERGHPVAIQGIGRDVTDRKLSQQRLIETAAELQLKNEELSTALRLAREATQLKEQFLANTSHELRTPLNGIMGMTNLLKDTPLIADQREYVEAVSQCANDLLTIINDLLDVSQIEAGHMSVDIERFDIRESLNAVIRMLQLKAAGKGLALTSAINPRVPATMFGDPLRFRQILINLIANAIKFTPSGSVRVCTTVLEEERTLRCRVIDSGIGVESSIQERIFEAFFQGDGTLRRRFGGTGLGLTISKQLVELMGGRIGTHNNEPNPGATFWFELPLKPNSLAGNSPGADLV